MKNFHSSDITNLLVESVEKIRIYPCEPPKHCTTLTIIPVHYLGWLRKKIGADSLSLFFFVKDGSAQRIRTIGDSQIISQWPLKTSKLELDFYIKKYENDPSYIIFPMSDNYRTHSGLDPIFGYIVLIKKSSFSDEEIKVLKGILTFLCSYIIHGSKINAMKQATEAQQFIFQSAISKIGSDRKLNKITERLYRLFGAAYFFYFTLNSYTAILEYARKPNYRGRPKIIKGGKKVNISKSFYEQCEKNAAFIWPKHSSIFKFEETLPKLSLIDNSVDYFFLVCPVVVFNTPIAMLVFVLTKNVVFYDKNSLFSVLNFSIDLLKESVTNKFQRRTNLMIVDPIFKTRDNRIKEDTIFVLMPFTEPWSDRIWEKILKPIIDGLGLKAIRADDLFGQDIMEDVWKGIVTSKLIIADITGRNPNVFYELGLAHTVGKPVVLLTQDSKDIPFDLNRYRHIIYEDNYDGYEILQKKLQLTIKEILSE